MTSHQDWTLSSFLTSISATSIDPAASCSTGRSPLAQHIASIDQEIALVKEQIHDALQLRREEWEHQWTTGVRLSEKLQQHEAELADLEVRVDHPEEGLKPRLLSTLEEHASLWQCHARSSTHLSALSSLAALYTSLAQLLAATKSGALTEAVARIPECKSVSSKLDDWLVESPLVKRARGKIRETEEDIRQRLVDAVRQGLAIEEGTGRIEISGLVGTGIPETFIEWQAATEALAQVGHLDGPMSKLAQDLGSHAIGPSLRCPESQEGVDSVLQPKFLLVADASPEGRRTVLHFESASHYSPLSTTLASLRLLLSHLKSTLCPTSPSTFAAFAQAIIPNLTAQFMSDFLVPALPPSPRSTARLLQVANLLPEAQAFSQWLISEGWTQTDTIGTFIVGIGQEWGRKMASALLERARNEVVGCKWEGESVEWEVTIERHPEPASLPLSPTPPTDATSSTTEPSVSSASPPLRPSLDLQRPSPAGGRREGLRSLFGGLGLVRSGSDPGAAKHRRAGSGQQPADPPIAAPDSSPAKPTRHVWTPSPPASPIEAAAPLQPVAQEPVGIVERKEAEDLDVDWDLGTDLSESALPVLSPLSEKAPPPPGPLPTPGIHQAEEELEDEEDAWGIGSSGDNGETEGAQVAQDRGTESARPPTHLEPANVHGQATCSPPGAHGQTGMELEDEADAWGLDNDGREEDIAPPTFGVPEGAATPDTGAPHGVSSSTQTQAHAQSSPKATGNAEDDGRGFGAGEGEAEGQPLRLRGGASSSAGSDAGDAGWGWADDEEAAAKPTTPTRERDKSQKTADMGPTPSQPALDRKIERITISIMSQRLLSSARDAIDGCRRIADPTFEYPVLSTAFPCLLQAAFDIFHLFRAVMPVHHAGLIESVPTLGIQFANDCSWLAKEVKSLQGPLVDPTVLDELSEKLVVLGDSVRARQMALQEAAIMECLDEADGFRSVSEPTQFANCDRAVRQVVHVVERLARAWQPIMPHSQYLTSLGKLIDAALRRIMEDIEDQPDIGDEESRTLNGLCKSLHGLSELFRVGGAETIVGKYVPTWFKFCFLSELLEASMADIMWMHQEGMLWEYTPAEIAGLIRALFADSALRSKNIDKIMYGTS